MLKVGIRSASQFLQQRSASGFNPGAVGDLSSALCLVLELQQLLQQSASRFNLGAQKQPTLEGTTGTACAARAERFFGVVDRWVAPSWKLWYFEMGPVWAYWHIQWSISVDGFSYALSLKLPRNSTAKGTFEHADIWLLFVCKYAPHEGDENLETKYK
ncbi:hypothetical protein BT96DRAFT_1005660 [Gymnopus androsaceus JB14]|uniref:Uncharacterized protein n=1 Tax=Gymnopus androsaceus JB14 TaxID=1447944 RepID=A0A6A4GN35_9AGAR|nr:hypothetical protein BT96DRAFT_1005660 [Gymnopus androsaceus JB14]